MKRIFAILVAAVLLLALSAPVLAAQVDLEQIGSVSVTLKYMGQPVPGGSLTLHKVGDLVWAEDHYIYTLTEPFAESGISLDALDSDVAQALAAYAIGNEIPGVKQEIDAEGHAAFADVSVGLYLMVQEDAAEGFSLVQPFLLTVPVSENGAYVYDVDASPKLSLVPEETEPTQPPTTTPPTKPGDKLPQTGQMSWPVPLLAIGGIFTFLAGLILNRSGRKKNYES